jgi:hypothetical protein
VFEIEFTVVDLIVQLELLEWVDQLELLECLGIMEVIDIYIKSKLNSHL